jgi:hypothetical protein
LPSSLGYRQTVRHGGRRIRQSSCSGLCLEHLAREIMLMHLWDTNPAWARVLPAV